MHRLILVILPKQFESVRDTVDQLLEPHCAETEVEPYKRYISPEINFEQYVQAAREEDTVNTELAEEMGWKRPWQRQFGKDEGGCYEITAFNPDPKMDYYQIGGSWNGIFTGMLDRELPEEEARAASKDDRVNGNVCYLKDLAAEMFRSYDLADHDWTTPLITPDGVWHGLSYLESRDGDQADSWYGQVAELRKRYAYHLVVAVNAHS